MFTDEEILEVNHFSVTNESFEINQDSYQRGISIGFLFPAIICFCIGRFITVTEGAANMMYDMLNVFGILLLLIAFGAWGLKAKAVLTPDKLVKRIRIWGIPTSTVSVCLLSGWTVDINIKIFSRPHGAVPDRTTPILQLHSIDSDSSQTITLAKFLLEEDAEAALTALLEWKVKFC